MYELREKANAKINELIDGKFYSKSELSKKLAMSYPTLYKRLEDKNWTGVEINIILNEL